MITDFRSIARPAADFIFSPRYIHLDAPNSLTQLQYISEFPNNKILFSDVNLLCTETFRRKSQHDVTDQISELSTFSNIIPDLPEQIESFTLFRFNDFAYSSLLNGRKLLFDLSSSLADFKGIRKAFAFPEMIFEGNSNFSNIFILNEVEPNSIPLANFESLHFKPFVPENSPFFGLDIEYQNFDHYNLNFEPYLSNGSKNIFPQQVDNLYGMDSCFFTRSEREIVEIGTSFLSSFEVPILKFSCQSVLAFEPFSDEWLCELKIEKEDFIDFTNSQTEKENKKHDFINFSLNNKVNEEYSPVALSLTNDVKSRLRSIFKDHENSKSEDENEREIPSNVLPPIVEINSRFFEADDIEQFSKLFTNIKIVGREIEKPVILTVNRKLVNILIVEEKIKNFANLISGYLESYENIVITSTTKPAICMCSRIKWRCITSHSQIVMAILPYLIAEDKTK